MLDLNSAGSVYLGFSNVRDCEAAVIRARTHCPEWVVEYISPAVFAQVSGTGWRTQDGNSWGLTTTGQKLAVSDQVTPEKEQQVLVKAHFLGVTTAFRSEAVEQLLQELLTNYGELLDYQVFQVREPGVFCAFATFRGQSAAKSAEQALNGLKIQVMSRTVLSRSVSSPVSSPNKTNRCATGLSIDRDAHQLSQRANFTRPSWSFCDLLTGALDRP